MKMKQWMDKGWLISHKTSAEEIENLLKKETRRAYGTNTL